MSKPPPITNRLNTAAARLIEQCRGDSTLRIDTLDVAGATVLDFGVQATGGLAAGLALARICLADGGDVSLDVERVDHHEQLAVTVRVDNPTAACLCAQYAGWQIASGDYFAMGSGPMRAVANVEPLFKDLEYFETGAPCVGVLESARLPDESVIEWIANKLQIAPQELTLCVAPTASLAGTIQIVARSLETALHQLHEKGFDTRRVVSGIGRAPLPPIAADDLTAIGWTNDAILYGGSVIVWVTGDDESITEIGPRVPSSSSRTYGKPFLELFEQAGRDFYKLDPALFSPAEIRFCNIDSGRVQHFGTIATDIVRKSFGQ